MVAVKGNETLNIKNNYQKYEDRAYNEFNFLCNCVRCNDELDLNKIE